MFTQTISIHDSPIATIIPMGQALRLSAPMRRDVEYVLSRFALIRRESDRFVIESPTARARVIVHDHRALSIVHAFATPRRVADVIAAFDAIPEESVSALVAMLFECGLIVKASGEEHPGWSFHDLLFHARSRQGRHDYPYGATFPMRSVIDPLPAVKPAMSEAAIPLNRPDIASLAESDRPFTDVLERRRSIRSHAVEPITVEQLGEFLFRTARVRSVFDDDASGYQRSSRPYPGAGGCYELEIYPVVTACTGVSPGMYHYDPLEHRLHHISEVTSAMEALATGAQRATGAETAPQVLLVMAARMLRLAWKYDSIAYSLALKDVGALMGTMCLAAEAMGLAGCAVGGGDADKFAEVSNNDYYVEPSVGEFILGSRIPHDSQISG